MYFLLIKCDTSSVHVQRDGESIVGELVGQVDWPTTSCRHVLTSLLRQHLGRRKTSKGCAGCCAVCRGLCVSLAPKRGVSCWILVSCGAHAAFFCLMEQHICNTADAVIQVFCIGSPATKRSQPNSLHPALACRLLPSASSGEPLLCVSADALPTSPIHAVPCPASKAVCLLARLQPSNHGSGHIPHLQTVMSPFK